MIVRQDSYFHHRGPPDLRHHVRVHWHYLEQPSRFLVLSVYLRLVAMVCPYGLFQLAALMPI